jgi:benzoyl-CoA reductase subunit C
MEQIIRRFKGIADQPYDYLSNWKAENNKKIIGCLPMYVPEEIIHAAGLLPVVLQKGSEQITLGHGHIQSYFCGIVRSLVDLIMKYKLDFLDGVVSPDICLAIRGLSNVAKKHLKVYFEDLFLPIATCNKASGPYIRDELDRFKASLEGFAGVKIDNDSLLRSVQIYNENRALLRELYDLRRNKPGLISAAEVSSIVVAGMVMPKEEHSKLLSELLPKLREKEAPSSTGVRVVLSGSVCESPPGDILDIIEEAGCVVVDDDLFAGARYFSWDLSVDGDPMEAIASRHLNMAISCPTRIDQGSDWSDYLLKLTGSSRARGVIFIIVKYCQPHDMYYPYLKQKLQDAGIPEIMIETEHELLSVGQVKTRVQAFIEMIRGN